MCDSFSFDSRVSPREMQNSDDANRCTSSGNQSTLPPNEREKSPAVTPKKVVGFTDSTTPRTNSSHNVSTSDSIDTKNPDFVTRPSTTGGGRRKEMDTSHCVTPPTETTTRNLKNPAAGLPHRITSSSERTTVVNPTMLGSTTACVATKKLRAVNTTTVQPPLDSKQTKISDSNSSPKTSRISDTPEKPPETPSPRNGCIGTSQQSLPPSTPKIAFQASAALLAAILILYSYR